jgi:hypothetical protein
MCDTSSIGYRITVLLEFVYVLSANAYRTLKNLFNKHRLF